MRKLLILTASFPYLPGEQFLEGEIRSWGECLPGTVTIVPARAAGPLRDIPEGVSVDLSCARPLSVLEKRVLGLRALFSGIFARELITLLAQKRISLPRVLIALKATARVFQVKGRLSPLLGAARGSVCVYSYWFDAQAYAAALLKREGLVQCLVSRAHRFDVYEELRPHAYMPLKKQFVRDFDEIMSISDEGRGYLCAQYGLDRERVSVHRLGVSVDGTFAAASSFGCLKVVSVSYCVPVKRVDKVIDALVDLVQRRPDLSVEWVHIGGGPLQRELAEYAERRLSNRGVAWEFRGELPNHEVRRYLKEASVDVFLNVSDSEGVPVSIMEAMSYGIPAVAPEVGGIPELVSDRVGKLLPVHPSPAAVAEALSDVEHFKDGSTRARARATIDAQYDAAKNYPQTVEAIIEVWGAE